jgi:hypothetical protein
MVRVAGFRIQIRIILGTVQVKFGVRKIQRVKRGQMQHNFTAEKSITRGLCLKFLVTVN